MTYHYPAGGEPPTNPWMPAPPAQQPGSYPPPPPPHAYGYGYPGYGYPVARRTNGLAIASMVVSIASLFMCWGLTGIVGALMGHAARKQINQRGEDGAGLATAGIIVGWIGTGISVLAIGFVIAAAIAGRLDNGG